MNDRITERLFAAHDAIMGSLGERPDDREGIVVGCMDERNTLTEEALGLAPASVIRFSSGGGRIGADDFVALFGDRLAALPPESRRVFLVTHEVVGKPDLGCAAFKNEIAEQERYFLALRRELTGRLKDSFVHAACMDTSTGAVRALETDSRDGAGIAVRLSTGIGAQFEIPEPEGHAGHGIYIGDAYRAWVGERNRFFHISPDAPSLTGDLGIALAVMLHHSAVRPDRENPLVLHVDHADVGGDRRRSREAVDRAVEAFMAGDDSRRLETEGLLRVVRTATDIETWSAQLMA